jgi:hypothetical protein
VAHLLVAAIAFRTSPTATDKRHGDAITHLPSGDIPPHRRYDPRQFVTRHMRQLNVRIMTFPAMPVASAYTRAKDLNNHTVTLGGRVFDCHQTWGLGKGFVNYGFHEDPSTLEKRSVWILVRGPTWPRSNANSNHKSPGT